MDRVSPPGADAYRASTYQYGYPSNPFTAAESVTVKVDPDDPAVRMIFRRA